ncbi:hypothetical protein RGL65_004501 [Vibrio parahaemolyticus]|nr:hypothetical protein [Vibrio parahaemolyticus]
MKSSKITSLRLLQQDKVDYLTSSEHKLTAMSHNEPISYLANNRYVFISTEYYF